MKNEEGKIKTSQAADRWQQTYYLESQNVADELKVNAFWVGKERGAIDLTKKLDVTIVGKTFERDA